MLESEITKIYLDEFIKNLSSNDALELNSILDFNLSDFFDFCLNKKEQTYFLVSKKKLPLAIGGVKRMNFSEKKIGKIWLLTTKYAEKYKIKLYKYYLEKINEFKFEYDILYNFIYKSNFSTLKWLEPLGFNILNFKNPDYKLFYLTKGDDNFDIRYFAC